MPDKTRYQLAQDKLTEKSAAVTVFWDARDAKLKEGETDDLKLSEDDRKSLDKLHGELKDASKAVEEFAEFQTIEGKAEALAKVLNKPVDRPELGPINQGLMKSPGTIAIESKEFQDYMKSIRNPDGDVTPGSFRPSPQIALKGLVMTTPTTAGGALVRRDYMPTVSLPLQPLSVRDIISVLRTGSNLIEYVRINSFTNAAARVPEATSTTDEAGRKPQSSLTMEIVQAAVKTIAHFFPITRQILADAPQLQGIIDTFGRDGLELALEEKVINGAGGADFLGLDNQTGLTLQAFDGDMLTTTRKARTKVKYIGRANPTAYVLNPIDWETLDLTQDNEARYYFGGPMVLGTPRLWGLPVVECEPVRQGTGFTGDMKQAVLWDRESATMHMTDSNRDWFELNILAILFELRAAFGVLRPAAIVKMDLHAGANS